MKACILVATRIRASEVASRVRHLPGVMDAFAVRRRLEVVVRADLHGMGHLAELLDSISDTEGVVISETLLEIPQEVTR